MAKRYEQSAGKVWWTNGTGGAVTEGAVVDLEDRAGVATQDMAASDTEWVYSEGLFDFAEKSGESFAVGDLVFVHNTTQDATADPPVQEITETALNNQFLGVVRADPNIRTGYRLVELMPYTAEGARKITAAAAADTTLTANDFRSKHLIVFVPNTTTVNLILPAIANVPIGAILEVRKTTADAAAVTIDPNASEQINGGATYASIDANNDYARFRSNGTSWDLVNADIA